MAITAFLSRSPGLLNRGPGAQPLCDMFLIPASSLQLTWTSCRRGYIIIWRRLFFLRASQFRTQFNPLDSQGHILIFLDRMNLLFTHVHFLFWLLGRVGGQYTTPGLKVLLAFNPFRFTINFLQIYTIQIRYDSIWNHLRANKWLKLNYYSCDNIWNHLTVCKQ